jgi:hypothetical protein
MKYFYVNIGKILISCSNILALLFFNKLIRKEKLVLRFPAFNTVNVQAKFIQIYSADAAVGCALWNAECNAKSH